MNFRTRGELGKKARKAAVLQSPLPLAEGGGLKGGGGKGVPVKQSAVCMCGCVYEVAYPRFQSVKAAENWRWFLSEARSPSSNHARKSVLF